MTKFRRMRNKLTVLLLGGVLVLFGCAERSSSPQDVVTEEGIPPSDIDLPSSPSRIAGFQLSGGCPSPKGLKQPTQLSKKEVLEALVLLQSNLDAARSVSDPAYWPFLEQKNWTGEKWTGSPDWLTEPRLAVSSPHANLIAHTCGENILRMIVWVQVCPGPCGNPESLNNVSLAGNYYLVKRQDRLLVWGAE